MAMVAELGFYRGRRRRAGESSHRRSPPAALCASSLPVPRPTRGSRGSGSRVTTPIPGPPGQGHDAEDGESDFSIALLDSAGADALPPGVDLSVFDMGVNAGIWRSVRLLQQALGFTGEEMDGSIGPETLAAAGVLHDVVSPVHRSSIPRSTALGIPGGGPPITHRTSGLPNLHYT